MIKSNTSKCKIYLLTNTENNKVYVGQTWLTYEKRMGKYGEGYSNSPYIYHAIQKYTLDKFAYTTLTECETQEEADKLEDYYIIKYNSRDLNIGYNLKEGGSHGRHLEETKQKMSENAFSPWLGKHLSEEMKQKISDSRSGIPHTEEWKQENSEMMKEWHANNPHPMEGKHHTEEAKQSMSKKLSGIKRDPESVKRGAEKRKMPLEREKAILADYLARITARELQKKYGISASSIYRILDRNGVERHGDRSNWAGKTHTPETKAKMSGSASKIWAERKINSDPK